MAGRRKSSFKSQDFEKITNDCLKNKELFCDEYFKLNVPDAVWLRPWEISKEPKFFVGGASRFNVIQGELKNCWLMVAIANITMNKKIFHNVVPTDQSFEKNYSGVFRFRTWQCGEWVEVVVDDRLPTVDGELIYAQSRQKNEFWCPLLEKAYAKLYGSYDQLTAGWFTESMVDFTGGIVETLKLVPEPLNLGKVLLKSIEKSSFMCVFMKGDPSKGEKVTEEGLVKGHAYSINNVKYVTTGNSSILLVRLRNPWGEIEWNGAWSDSSPEWKSVSDEDKDKIGLKNDNDGEFWMSLSDFTRNFQYIEICHLGPGLFQDVIQGEAKLGWEERSFKGDWIKDLNAGGVSRETFHLNPQFRITLAEKDDDDEEDLCTLVIALMQKNKTRRVWHRIGFRAFKLDEQESLTNTLNEEYLNKMSSTAITSSFKHAREIVMRTKWTPGVYYIIPSTYTPNQEGQFLLRVFTEKTSTMEEIGEVSPEQKEGASKSSAIGVLTVPQAAIQEKSSKRLVYRSDQEIKSLFNRISGKAGEIGWQGLQSLLQFALTPDFGLFTRPADTRDVKFPKYECRTLIAMLDDDRNGKLDFDEFQSLWGKIRQWESAFLQCSQNTNYIKAPELKQALIKAGYHLTCSTLGSLLRRYADDEGKLGFDDFVMCAVELLTS